MRMTGGLLSSLALLLIGCGNEVGHSASPLLQGAAGACDPSRQPWYRPDPPACCLDGTDEWFIFGGVPARLNHRTHGNACTSDGVAGPCVGMACAFGPCGASRAIGFDPPAHVFVPFSDPTICGRQAATLPGFPEEWTPEHVSYPGLTPTCRFNECGDSRPLMRISVTIVNNGASGEVESHPDGILLEGAGTADFPFTTTNVSFLAKPRGAHARARFSGGCVASGEYGKPADCAELQRILLPVPLTGPHATTVTFDCEPGYTCPG
jgi:hypothetical protein